jgi:UDP-N-acetylglucosamine 2-epimerase
MRVTTRMFAPGGVTPAEGTQPTRVSERPSSERPSSRRPRVLSVIGARPEIIQAAPVSTALAEVAQEILVHTGQHYDEAMSEGQIADTGLLRPHYNLGVGSRSRAQQLGIAHMRLAEVIERERPDAVLVRGDTNATLSGARAAAAAGVPLVHVEAGLRSHREDMPEEHNRVQTDRLAQLLLAPTPGARRNLLDEELPGEIHVTGDPLCDTLERWRPRVQPAGGNYLLATVHRNYNTDSPERLQAVLKCLARSPWPVLMPLHPRTRARMAKWDLEVSPWIRLLGPVSYSRMLALERGANAIATDSGGVQREAYMWGVPCLTLREETEWSDTLHTGWNMLVGVDPEAFQAALARPLPTERPPIFGDGHAAPRIAAIVVDFLERGATRSPATDRVPPGSAQPGCYDRSPARSPATTGHPPMHTPALTGCLDRSATRSPATTGRLKAAPSPSPSPSPTPAREAAA